MFSSNKLATICMLCVTGSVHIYGGHRKVYAQTACPSKCQCDGVFEEREGDIQWQTEQ